MDYDILVKLVDDEPLIKKLLVWLQSHEMSIHTLGVNEAVQATAIEYYDLVSAFKALEKIGAGHFIVGRKGHDSRIIWEYDTKSIAEVGTNGLDYVDAFGWSSFPTVPNDAINLIGLPKAETKIETMKHSLHLRKDFKVEIELPDDISEDEVEKLKRWLDVISL